MRFDGDADDHLTRLIRRADDDAASPLAATGDLAARVRKRHNRRRLVRTGATSIAVALAVVGFVTWRLLDGGPPAQQPIAVVDVPPVVGNVSTAAIQATLDQLERECELREAAVARMLASERRRAEGSRTAAAAPAAVDLAWQREQAALVLVRQGDRMAQDLNLPQSAVAAYRQARDTFPGTRWAAIADARLSQSESIH